MSTAEPPNCDGESASRDRRRMSSIIRDGDTFHGISVAGRGGFANDEKGETYAGQCKDGYAFGLGVLTRSHGTKVYAEHGPDGKFDRRWLARFRNGNTFYRLYERGEMKAYALVQARCVYNCEVCAPDDPRLLALIAQVAPVEVRPATPAPNPSSAASRPKAIVRCNGSFWNRRRSPPPWPLRCTPTLRAVAGGRAAQPKSSRAAKHDHTATRARAVLR
jgi:hypothetical protein